MAPRKNTGNHPTEPQPAPIGHNNPPSQAELLAEKHKPLIERLDKLRAEANELPTVIKNEEHLTAVTAVVLKVRALSDDERKAFKADKDYWLKGGREVDSFFNTTLKDKLENIAERLDARCDAYAAEQDRLARAKALEVARKAEEEAKRQAALAAKHENTGRAAQHETRAAVFESRAEETGAAANAPVADLTRTRVEGATFSGTGTWGGKIENLAELQAALGPLGAYFKVADLDSAIGRMAKATEGRIALPGVKFEKTISANIRKR